MSRRKDLPGSVATWATNWPPAEALVDRGRRVRRASLPRDGTVIPSRVTSLEAGAGLNQLAVRLSQAARLPVGAVRSSARSRFPRLQRQAGAIRLEHVPMLTTMTERMTTEVQCRRYAAHHLNLAKSSRSQSEKMLLLALAEWWLDIAERVNQGWRPHRCSAESRLDRYAL